jgi:hypothetical protein
MLNLRPERAQNRGAQQKAGQELPHDGGLADPLHRLPHQASDQEQDNDLRQENDF